MSRMLAVDVALGCLGVYLLSTLLSKSTSKAKRPPLPPGPKPKPVIGNLSDLPPPGELEWLHWAKHKDLYGPISSVTVFGQSIIIVNDLQTAYELLDKRSSVFSDRPVLPFAGIMCGFENALAMIRYGDRFRTLRRYLHQYMGSSAAMAQHHPLQELETRQFLLRLLERSETEKLQDQIRNTTGSLILKMSHGYTTEKNGPDPLVTLADDVLGQFSLAAQAGAWMVDLLPFLQNVPDWMPGTAFKRIGAKWRADLMKIVDLPHAFVKQQMASGTYSPSFTSAFLEDTGSGPSVESEEDDFLLKWAGFAIYGGGADTTVSALHSFFLAMLLYPDVQKAAQAELDRVLSSGSSSNSSSGPERLPTFSDRENLPYIDALVKETLRWNPVVPLCIPHTASEDSTYNGYFIPKGAVVLPNIWWFTHDPTSYTHPSRFNPTRFLGPNPERDPHDVAFGFGRRICPGKELADASLFVTIAMVLSVFNVERVKGKERGEVEVREEYTSGVISHPKEFACKLTPRSERAVQLIRAVQEEHAVDVSDAEALKSVKY